MTHQILSGHTSFESAYVIEDYPYGRQLRCQRKCWIEVANKGSKKGQMRFVSCTTNPKLAGEHWNKPHAGQYSDFVIMYLDAETSHVEIAKTDVYSLSRVEEFKAKWYELLTSEQRSQFDEIEKVCRALNSINWRITSSNSPD